jgi:ribosomal protein S18 acetylase RimI-like enzyme
VRGRSADCRSGLAPRVSLAVRPGTPADREFVEALAAHTVMASVASFRQPVETMVQFSLGRLLDIVERQSHVTLIAQWEGKPAGFILMLDDLPDEVTATPQGFVAYMAVEPSLQRRGIGSALLRAAEDEAKRRALPYMALMVTEENAAALALYERSGYVTERRLLCKRL